MRALMWQLSLPGTFTGRCFCFPPLRPLPRGISHASKPFPTPHLQLGVLTSPVPWQLCARVFAPRMAGGS